MKKIPIHSNPNLASDPGGARGDELAPGFLLNAIEILLLGALWLFVLIWLPFLQHQAQQPQVEPPLEWAALLTPVFRLHWLTVLGLSVVTLLLLRLGRGLRAVTMLDTVLLAGLALVSLLMLLFGATLGDALSVPVCVAQALLGLAYYVSSRVRLK